MNYTLQNNLVLFGRNEGKIKSYRSCSDIRAWSHDVNAKDRHLREWMKCDMPICVVPVSALTGFLKTMTCRSRRRVAPRCHPDCKSKVLLESICTSCHAMRECIKQDANFEKYFVEEELETSQWPCERCLEALKSIKMFWKIITDKIFYFNIQKKKDFEIDSNSGDCLTSVAKTWQTEMVQQAIYGKNLTSNKSFLKSTSPKTETNQEASQHTIKSLPAGEKTCLKQIGRIRYTSCTIKPHESKFESRNAIVGINKKLNRNTHTKVKVKDTGCDTCFLERENDEIQAHLKNLQVLQELCNGHIEEVERLKTENHSLKTELENVYNSSHWKASFYCPDKHDTNAFVLKPFEVALEEKCPAPTKNIDSEMTITVKKCKHENFGHVSLLKVVHKTNEPRIEDLKNGKFYKKDDPIELLTKVQNTFEAIVKREISIAHGRRHRSKQESDIEATFRKINTSNSAPSCSTLSSKFSSELNFVSAKETTDIHNNRYSNLGTSYVI